MKQETFPFPRREFREWRAAGLIPKATVKQYVKARVGFGFADRQRERVKKRSGKKQPKQQLELFG